MQLLLIVVGGTVTVIELLEELLQLLCSPAQ